MFIWLARPLVVYIGIYQRRFGTIPARLNRIPIRYEKTIDGQENLGWAETIRRSTLA